MYAIILAGGSGTRLWPKSRENSPKQLHRFVTNKTLFETTIDRVSPIVPFHNIFVVTNAAYAHKLKAQAPKIPVDNILIEPYPLGTSLAIGLAAVKIQKLSPDEKIIVMWSDNHIEKHIEFLQAITFAEEVCEHYDGVIIGVRPTFASTQYGYIKMGDEFYENDALRVKAFKIDKFIEKPNEEQAKEFLESWSYLWNTGMSVWKVSRLLALFKQFLPDHFAALQKVVLASNQTEEERLSAALFADLDKIAIDYAIYEKAENLAVIPADLGWSDIGTWNILKDVLPNTDGHQNAVKAKHIGIDTQNCLIQGGERLIATIGISDLIIVDTDDALLIVPKDKAPQVKDLTKKLKEEGMEEYL